MRVLILHDDVAPDARADEVDALVQAALVRSELCALGHDVSQCGVTLALDGLHERLRLEPPDLVVNLVESLGGRGSLIHLAPSVVEAAGIAMTGCNAAAMMQTSNKLMAKRVMTLAGIATPAWIEVGGRAPDAHETRGRWIIKSVWEHASVGLTEESIIDVFDCETLLDAFESRRTDATGDVFAERFIDGREFNVALLESERGVDVLPIAEIRFDAFADHQPRIVGYAAKWDEASFEYHHTPRTFEFGASDEALVARLRDTALQCWRVFGLSGYARVDFRVDESGHVWALEVNANPCLSSDAGYFAAAERAGLTMGDVVRHLVDAALRRTVHSAVSRR